MESPPGNWERGAVFLGLTLIALFFLMFVLRKSPKAEWGHSKHLGSNQSLQVKKLIGILQKIVWLRRRSTTVQGGKKAVKRPRNLPAWLKVIFWDYDFGRLRWEEDRDLIISRILSHGNWQALQWLRSGVDSSSLPLPHFIEHLYRKHFRKDRPEVVMSVEEKVEMDRRKKLARRAKKKKVRVQTGEEPTPMNGKVNP